MIVTVVCASTGFAVTLPCDTLAAVDELDHTADCVTSFDDPSLYFAVQVKFATFPTASEDTPEIDTEDSDFVGAGVEDFRV